MDENIENTAEPIEAINIDEPAQANNIEETTTVEAVPEPANNEAEAEPANNEAEAEPANNEVAMESTETSQPTETSPEYGDYTPPVKPARTEKQSEHDEGAAKMLVEMREKYETAFEKVPEKKRPKAKAWAARAAYFKLINEGEKEKDKYIDQQIETDRAAMSGNKPVAKNTVTNKNVKASAQNFVYSLNNTVDAAVESATVSVEQAATNGPTRKAAKRFISILRRSTQKLKSSLMRKIGSPNSQQNNNAQESSNSTNYDSPYKTRVETVPVSNNEEGHITGSLEPENSGSAMNNSLPEPEPEETTTSPEEKYEPEPTPEENSSLNLDMRGLNLSEPAAPTPTSNDYYKPYENMKIGERKPKSKKRARNLNFNASNSGYESPRYTSENTPSNRRSIGSTKKRKAKRAKKVSVPPISNAQEF